MFLNDRWEVDYFGFIQPESRMGPSDRLETALLCGKVSEDSSLQYPDVFNCILRYTFFNVLESNGVLIADLMNL